MKGYEIFSTTADIGIKIQGKSYNQLYSNAIAGFNVLVFGKEWRSMFHRVSSHHPFHYKGDSCENVLVNLLSELIFLLYTQSRIIRDMNIKKADKNTLEADLYTGIIDKEPETEIKSVTYHNLHIREEKGVKSVRIIFDI